jgi:TRAP-type uncharacterized transport system substrate-binding protein
MPAVIRHALISVRDLLITAGPFVAVALVVLALAYWMLDPTPPKRMVLATGPAQSAYDEFGKRYAAELKKQGITVTLRPTEGSAENLRLLQDPASGVQAAFVQGGAIASAQAARGGEPDPANESIASLGNLFHEPLWLFYRAQGADGRERALHSLADLQGLKVQVGTAGSGVPALVAQLLEGNQVDPKQLTLLTDAQTQAVMSFLAGGCDAIVFASAPESPMVQMLLLTPGVKLFDFTQAEAYSRRFAYLSAVTLPRGIVNLAQDMPPQPVGLVATTTALLARDDLHPALRQLLVQAAQGIHGGPGWFRRKGEFPNAGFAELPLDKEAQRYYRDGPPLLQRYAPFWLANVVDRMWVVLLSITVVLVPLSRIIPPVYRFRIRSRIFRWYGQLRGIEDRLAHGTGEVHGELLRQLDALDRKAAAISVPLAYADELYALRSNIELVRQRIAQTRPGASVSSD